jgi:hypothetical protein
VGNSKHGVMALLGAMALGVVVGQAVAQPAGEPAMPPAEGVPALKDPPPMPEPAPMTEEAVAKVRGQIFVLVPHISMSMENRLTMGTPVANVLEEFDTLHEFKDSTFDAHPTMQRVGRDLTSFLVQSRGRVTPAMQNAHLPAVEPRVDDEYVFVLALLQVFYEAAKNEALRSWQADFDVKCRSGYHDLMPLLRKVAKGKKPPRAPVKITGAFNKERWVYLVATNDTDAPLTNATLAVKMATIDGRAAEHYYFVSKWDPRKKLPLRIAVDWLPVDADATTSGQVELVSDEFVAPPTAFAVDDNIPTAGDKCLAECASQFGGRRQVAVITRRLELMKPLLQQYQDRAARVEELLRSTRGFVGDRIKKFDADITEQEKSVGRAKEQLTKTKGESQRRRLQEQIDSSLKKIAELKRQKADVTSGKV